MKNNSFYGHVFSKNQRLSARFAMLVIIALVTIFGSSCNTLPSAAGSADPRFMSTGLTNFADQSVNVVVRDPLTEKVYVGGRFTSFHDATTASIALYDPVADRWSPLATGGVTLADGSPGTVNAFAFQGRYLYVGGTFSRSADGSATGLGNIARYDTENGTWSTLSGGSPDSVRVLAINGNDLYFSAGNILTRYNTSTNTSNGTLFLTGNRINALAVFAGDVFAGGMFDTVPGVPSTNIARYHPQTDTWLPIAGGGLDGEVFAIAATPQGVYVGGDFSGTSDFQISLNKTAFLDSTGWSPLPGDGLNSSVRAMTTLGNDLYVGGTFTQSYDGATQLNRVARLHNLQWSGLAGGGLTLRGFAGGGDGQVTTLADAGDLLYIGGFFTETDDSTVKGLNGFARYGPPAGNRGEKAAWTTTTGFIPFQGGIGLNGEVRAVEEGPGGMLYVGGDFTAAFDGTAGLGRLARFDPSSGTWSALALGGLNGRVRALAISGNNLFVGGDFTFPAQGGPALNRIAKYDLTTNTWSAMPRNGLDNSVYTMKVVGNNLFLGGLFQNTRDFVQRLNLIARYDLTANTWSQLANDGFSGGVVMTLGLRGSDLIVGGYFFGNADGSNQNMRNLIFYNTTAATWTLPANVGPDSFVEVMAIDGDRMMLRGTFQGTADGTIVGFSGLANYDLSTNQWSFVGGNADTRLLMQKTNASKRVGNDMYIGGSFTSVGGRIALYFTRIYLQQWAGPAPREMAADWFAGANWTTGTPPSTNTSVMIPASAPTIDILTADVTLKDLMLNGGVLNVGAGRTLTINGSLALNGGKIGGAGSVVVTNCKPDAVSAGVSTSYILTTLTRCVNDLGPYNYDVGTANGYAPVIVRDIAGSGNVSIKAKLGAYSNTATGLPVDRLARWWQIENPGGGVTSSNVIFGYNDADILGVESGYRAYRISGGNANLVTSTVNVYSNRVTAANVTGFSDWTLAQGVSTAAPVSVTGRVLTAEGRGITNVVVTITDQSGNQRTVMTGRFGTFRFDGLTAGETCVLTVRSRRFTFDTPTRVITLVDNVEDVYFIASPPQVRSKALTINYDKFRSVR